MEEDMMKPSSDSDEEKAGGDFSVDTKKKIR